MQTTSVQKQNKKLKTIMQEKGGFNMFETMKKRIKNEKGLTLIELLAVIVILAIVAAIAVPAIGNIIENSRYKAAKSDAVMLLDAANLYFTDISAKDNDTVKLDTLITNGYVDDGATFKTNAANVNFTKKTGGNTMYGVAVYSGTKTVTFGTSTSEITKEKINADNRTAKNARDTTTGNITITN